MSYNNEDAASPEPAERLPTLIAFVGVVGSAITLIATLQDLAALAGWMRSAIEAWEFGSNLFWRLVGSLLSLKLDPWQSAVLTFGSFILTTSIGVRLDNRPPRIGWWGVLGRLLLLGIFTLVLVSATVVYLMSELSYAPGRRQWVTALVMAGLYIPCASLAVYLSQPNFSASTRDTWGAIGLGSGIALLFAVAISRDAAMPPDIAALFLGLVFGLLSGLAVAAPLLLAPHGPVCRRYVAIYGIVLGALLISEASKLVGAT